MQKRGISHHLDWIIGITLFMFFVVFVIATIKPGVQPLHSKDVLLNIIQDQFEENVTWEIQRVPLNIIAHSCVNSIQLTAPIEFPFNWNNQNTKVYNKLNNNPIGFSISGSTLIVEFVSGNAEQDYFILQSDEENFGSGTSIISICIKDDVTSIYGVPETLTGLSQDKIDILKNYNYDQLKIDWKYPITSDFNITINLEGHIYEVSSGKAPASNAEVYVKQYTDFILEEDGEKIPAMVTIKAW